MSDFLLTLRIKLNLDAERMRLMQKLMIILGVILLCAFFTPRLPNRWAITLIIGICGFGAMLYFLRFPQLGIPMLVAASIAIPFSIGTGSPLNAAILAVIGFGAIWLVDMIIYQRRIILIPHRVNLPLIALSVVSILAFLNGQLPWYSLVSYRAPIDAQLGGLAVFLLSAFAFLLVINRLQDIRWLEYTTWIFLFLAGFQFLAEAIPYLGQFVNTSFRTVVVGGSLFWVWLISLSASQVLYNHKLKYQWRIILGGLLLAVIYIILTQRYTWKSGWIPPLFALGAIFWFGMPKLRLPIIISGIIVAFIYYADLTGFATGAEAYSISTRFEAWRIILEIIKVNPILGLGPANYYWYTPLFPILGWSVRFNSHNNYIDLIAQIGISGLICFIWFAWEVFRTGWKLLPRVTEGFSKAYVIGALGGLIGTLVAGMLGDWFLPFIYNVGFKGFRSSILSWIFLGGIVVIEQSILNKKYNTQ